MKKVIQLPAYLFTSCISDVVPPLTFQILESIQDAILRRLHDDDLTVVQAALTLNILDDIINPSALLDALENVLHRCIGILTSSEFLYICSFLLGRSGSLFVFVCSPSNCG